MNTPRYIGRFAPTPSGFLHFGSLVAALASWLDARAVGGQWLLRMEDIDPPREAPGAQAAILHTLESYGLHWDGAVVYQSQRHDAYAAVVAETYNQAKDAAQFEKIVDHWGIRRSHPLFWQYFHDLSEYIRETTPVEEGVLDMNRYENL